MGVRVRASIRVFGATCRGLVAALERLAPWLCWARSGKPAVAARSQREGGLGGSRVAHVPSKRLCAPLVGALRSCPKLGGALVLHEELAPAASATCERSASTAICRRSWSCERPRLRRAHALPVRAARVPLRRAAPPSGARRRAGGRRGVQTRVGPYLKRPSASEALASFSSGKASPSPVNCWVLGKYPYHYQQTARVV